MCYTKPMRFYCLIGLEEETKKLPHISVKIFCFLWKCLLVIKYITFICNQNQNFISPITYIFYYYIELYH